MNNRVCNTMRKVGLALWGTVLLLGGLEYVSSGKPTTGSKPNIILIMADDLGYGDLGCYGQKFIRTPHIDALAEEGQRFTQAYAGGPVCTPSRSVLMTGLHNGHTSARDNIPHYHTYLKNDDITIAEILKEAGYLCGGVGKWSLGDAGTVGRATNQGFDMWFGYLNQDHAHFYYPEYLDDSQGREGRLELPGNSRTREIYSHDLMTQRSLEFIRESAGQSFFLYTAYTLPHFSSGSEDPDRLAVPSLQPYADESWSPAAKKYAAMVTLLDRDVGRIVDLVEELSLTDNTLIILTSDNGPLGSGPQEELDNNGPLRGAKRDLYEGGIRVPFIARWPGRIPAQQVSDEIVTFWDMLPTLAEIAGGNIPGGIDGISLVDALVGRPMRESHEYLYWDYGHTRSAYHQAVRIADFKGIRHGSSEPIELYNLRNDLGEIRDVASRHPDIVRRIEQIMETASIPSDRYPVGQRYQGSAIWEASDHW